MDRMKAQCQRFGARFEFDEIVQADLSKRPFVLTSGAGDTIEADGVVIATGATAWWLGIESETRLKGHGVSACATCDGFFFQKVPVAVIGGGDSAMEEAMFLTKFASKVYVIVRTERLRASKIMQDRARKNPKLEFVWNSTVAECLGEHKLDGLTLQNTLSGETSHLDVKGLFLAIGHVPNTAVFAGQVDMDENGYVRARAGSSYTNVPGVFAAGDVQDQVYRQAITAAGSGCMAALDCERWLEAQG
jgi:thioredoxin reductase (NADPH)